MQQGHSWWLCPKCPPFTFREWTQSCHVVGCVQSNLFTRNGDLYSVHTRPVLITQPETRIRIQTNRPYYCTEIQTVCMIQSMHDTDRVHDTEYAWYRQSAWYRVCMIQTECMIQSMHDTDRVHDTEYAWYRQSAWYRVCMIQTECMIQSMHDTDRVHDTEYAWYRQSAWYRVCMIQTECMIQSMHDTDRVHDTEYAWYRQSAWYRVCMIHTACMIHTVSGMIWKLCLASCFLNPDVVSLLDFRSLVINRFLIWLDESTVGYMATTPSGIKVGWLPLPVVSK